MHLFFNLFSGSGEEDWQRWYPSVWNPDAARLGPMWPHPYPPWGGGCLPELDIDDGQRTSSYHNSSLKPSAQIQILRKEGPCRNKTKPKTGQDLQRWNPSGTYVAPPWYHEEFCSRNRLCDIKHPLSVCGLKIN